jgi:hypothetical protein
MKKSILLTLVLTVLSSCATYHYAQKVKTISFSENMTKGTSVGPIRGEDCTWTVFNQQLGGAPTIDKAFMNAKEQSGAVSAAGFGALTTKDTSKEIRYINNANTSNEGFQAYLFGKSCLVVTGIGYK